MTLQGEVLGSSGTPHTTQLSHNTLQHHKGHPDWVGDLGATPSAVRCKGGHTQQCQSSHHTRRGAGPDPVTSQHSHEVMVTEWQGHTAAS